MDRKRKGTSESDTIIRHKESRGEQTLTIIAAPVYVDTATVVASKLGEGETCGVGCGQNECENTSALLPSKKVITK